MRLTKQKKLILDIINNSHEHLSAESIYNECRKVLPNISLGTVYRNLNAFAMKGKIRKIELPNAKDRFDWNLHHHDHALCLCCGNVVDIESKYVRKRHMMLEGFKVQEIELLYKGICQECQNKKAS